MQVVSIVDGVVNKVIKPKRYTDIMKRVVIVSLEPNVVNDPNKIGRRHHVWGIGSYIDCRVEYGKLVGIETGVLNNSFDLWCVVDTALASSGTVHVIGDMMGATLTLTQFWREVEEGNYYLASDDWRLKDLKESGKDDRHKGIFCIEDPPIIIQCWHKRSKRRVIILDTANYLPCNVEKLHRDLDIGELPEKASGGAFIANSVRCEMKCQAIFKLMDSIIKSAHLKGLKTVRATASGTAYDMFLRKYHNGSIHYHENAVAKSIERQGLFGGICEVFQHGTVNGPVYVLDVNSLYPYVMQCEPMPVKLVDVYDQIYMPDLTSIIHNKGIIAECLLETDDYTFPYRSERGVIYPRGKYWTVLPSAEIMSAFDLSILRRIGRCCVYEMGMPFNGFVNDMYDTRSGHRDRGETASAVWCKYLMNSLTGRFARRDRIWVNDNEEAPIMPWGVWAKVRSGERLPNYYRAVNWNVQRRGLPCEGDESCPAIFAHITSSARTYMRYLIDVAGAENVYYMDTDSMHVSEEGLRTLQMHGCIDSQSLGKLKIETVAQEAHYYGIKDYRLDNVVKISGMSATVDDKYSRSPDIWVYPRLQSILHSKPKGYITGESIKMNLSPCNVKGDVNEHGRVIPYRITEDYDAFHARCFGSPARAFGRDLPTYRGNSRKEIRR